ncbi:MAG: hypothetical protein ABIY90_09665 [Puia sp.]
MHQQHLERLIAKLDYEWFKKKKDCFLSETFYDSSRKCIYGVINEDPVFDEEGNKIDEVYETTIDISLTNYCWKSEYPHSSNHAEEYALELPLDSSFIAYEVIRIIKGLTEQLISNHEKHTIISSDIRTIEELIREYIKESIDVEFNLVLTEFCKRVRMIAYKEFGIIKRIHELTNDYSDKLKFDISQDQLAALIHILIQAEIIENPYISDAAVINFCSTYFQFKNQKTGTYTPAKDLGKKLSKVRNGEADTAVARLKDKLKAVI